ncbi:MAG: octaprenyl-diphosphate synthase [Oleispira sp.]|jgi:octaprenyl-diphosphate synthase
MQVKDIYALIEQDFADVDTLIREQLSSRVPLVEKIADYIVSSGGKRLRPLLVIMTAKALNKPGAQANKLAAIIEFLHTATLLHDDVVDTSDMRRGNPTANEKWGNAPSVLVGDFLYSRSFQMMVELKSLQVMAILSNATCVIAEGEVLQLVNCKNPDTSEEQYMEVIKGKTAMLFEASTHSAAILCEANGEQEKALKDYGHHIGMAFQLVDDVLDYDGDADTMGKNVGDDLAEGKATLPLIHAMREGTHKQAKLIRTAIRKGGLEDIDAIMEIVKTCGSLEYTKQIARKHVELAQQCLNHLADTDAKRALHRLADIAIERNT